MVRARDSTGAVDPARHQAVADLVIGGRRGRRISRETIDHGLRTVEMLVDRSRPMDIRREQPFEAIPTASLDRIEDIAHRGNLLCHDGHRSGAPSYGVRSSIRAMPGGRRVVCMTFPVRTLTMRTVR